MQCFIVMRCLDCHEDQDTQHVNTISSLHRSKVGSISAAEAVKSLQQPVLVKADPLGHRGTEQRRGGLIFSRTLHSYPRLQPPKLVFMWSLCLIEGKQGCGHWTNTGLGQGEVTKRPRLLCSPAPLLPPSPLSDSGQYQQFYFNFNL